MHCLYLANYEYVLSRRLKRWLCDWSQLAVTPTPRTADEPISIHYDTRLTLKVEGVVQVGATHGRKPRRQRVRAVELAVESIQQSRSATGNNDNVSAPAVCSSLRLTRLSTLIGSHSSEYGPWTWWSFHSAVTICNTVQRQCHCTHGMLKCSVLFFSRPRSEGWPYHGRIFSIYLCPLSIWLTLLWAVLSTSWC